LDKSYVDREQLAAAIRLYGASLKDSLLYNRYKLDETIQAVITRCHELDDPGRQVLTALRDFWQTDANAEGVSLLKAERIAREREPGDGSSQTNVVDRIEQALKEMDGC
jgi:NAD-dependent DNA ligase